MKRLLDLVSLLVREAKGMPLALAYFFVFCLVAPTLMVKTIWCRMRHKKYWRPLIQPTGEVDPRYFSCSKCHAGHLKNNSVGVNPDDSLQNSD